MKKIVLSILVCSSLLLSAETIEIQEQLKIDIAKAKDDVSKAKARIKDLEAKLLNNEKFVTHTELGFIKTDGNTATESLNFDAEIKKGWSKNLFILSLDAQYAKDNDIESKNKYTAEIEYNYLITDRLSSVALLGYKRDKFSGFDSQFYIGPGLKYALIKTSTQDLNIEGNILYSIDEIEDINYNAAGEIINYPNAQNEPIASSMSGKTNKYGAYRAKALYTLEIFENLKFKQELSYKAEIDDSKIYFIFSNTAFSSKLSDIFSAGISYKLDYVNSPPGEKENKDSTLSINLIIDY